MCYKCTIKVYDQEKRAVSCQNLESHVYNMHDHYFLLCALKGLHCLHAVRKSVQVLLVSYTLLLQFCVIIFSVM